MLFCNNLDQKIIIFEQIWHNFESIFFPATLASEKVKFKFRALFVTAWSLYVLQRQEALIRFSLKINVLSALEIRLPFRMYTV